MNTIVIDVRRTKTYYILILYYRLQSIQRLQCLKLKNIHHSWVLTDRLALRVGHICGPSGDEGDLGSLGGLGGFVIVVQWPGFWLLSIYIMIYSELEYKNPLFS